MVESGFQDSDSLLATSRGGVVSARGTNEGVTLRLDGRVAEESLKTALSEFMKPRKSFLGGQEVSLEWVGSRPQGGLVDQITKILCDDYGVAVKASKLKEPTTAATIPLPTAAASASSISVAAPQKESKGTATAASDDSGDLDLDSLDEEVPPNFGLFSGLGEIKNAATTSKEKVSPKVSTSAPLADPSLWDHPDARIVYATLRSGQRIDSEHTVVVVGDVNPGAEIVSGGDVIVLGSLRGVAHAGAYDETGGGKTIFALCLQPTQLRIGATLSRGSAEGGKVPEIAKIEGNMIVVEPFMKKAAGKRWLDF